MSNREYLDILCNTGDGVFIVDSNRHIIRWNKAAEKILKYPESEVLNHECYRVISGRVLPDKVFCGQNCKIHNDVFKGNTQQNFDLRTQTLFKFHGFYVIALRSRSNKQQYLG